jgi:hypothetical protein
MYTSNCHSYHYIQRWNIFICQPFHKFYQNIFINLQSLPVSFKYLSLILFSSKSTTWNDLCDKHCLPINVKPLYCDRDLYMHFMSSQITTSCMPLTSNCTRVDWRTGKRISTLTGLRSAMLYMYLPSSTYIFRWKATIKLVYHQILLQ